MKQTDEKNSIKYDAKVIKSEGFPTRIIGGKIEMLDIIRSRPLKNIHFAVLLLIKQLGCLPRFRYIKKFQ